MSIRKSCAQEMQQPGEHSIGGRLILPSYLHLRFVLSEDGGEQGPDRAEVGPRRAVVLRRRRCCP